MEEHVSWITHFVNQHLGGVAVALLHALHIQPSHPDLPIPESVVMAMVVFVIGALGTLWLKPRLSVDNPGGAQQIAELLITNPIGFGIRDLLIENSHDKKGKYFRDGRFGGRLHPAREFVERFSRVFRAHGSDFGAPGLRDRDLPVFQLAGNQTS